MPATIEKNVPMPVAKTGEGVNPISRLEVGDSFLSPAGTNINNLNSHITYYSKKLNRKFALRTRYQERDGESGIRVWRTV